MMASKYPTVRPSLMLDFQKSKQLDPRISFSRSSAATYVEGGVIKYAYEHQARFEDEGLLLEGSGTNDTYPSTFDGTPGTWRYTNYVNPDQTTAPDGTNTGALLDFEMNGANGNLNFDSGTPQVSGTRSFSFWCKTASPGSGTVMNLRMASWTFADGNTGTRTYTFNFDTKTKDTAKGDGSDFEVQPYSNGWYRCMISNLRNGGFLSFRIDKNPQNWYIWGMQSEEGTFCTSYIPSADSTVTRAADTCQLTGSNFYPYINQNAFTILFKSGPVENNAMLLGWGAGGTNLGQITPSANFPYINNFQNAGSQQINLTTLFDTDGSLLQATAYAENDFAGQSRGRQKLGIEPSTSSGPCPVLNLGTTQGIKFCGYTYNGQNDTTKVHIKSLAIYSERLTNEQLDAITL